MARKFGHYFKDVSNLQCIDVYRVLKLFGVTDPCIQHAIKKLLVSGKRGAKNSIEDRMEAIESIKRSIEIDMEDQPRVEG